MALGYPTEESGIMLGAQSSASPISTVVCLRAMLAEFFPVGLFALGLLLAIDRFGLVTGVVAGSVLGGLACWLLMRLIAASPILQWIAAAFVLGEIAWVVLSFV